MSLRRLIPANPALGHSVSLATRRSPLATLLVRLEPWLAVPCALVLLLYPNPLVLPAAILGTLPIGVRWLTTGRPWPRTAFDLPLALVAVGALVGAGAGLSREGTGLRLSGLLAGLLLYVAILEHATTPRRLRGVVVAALLLTIAAVSLLLLVVEPWLWGLHRVPPLAALIHTLDPSGVLGRWSDDDVLLQRYRLRASGIGALADVGLALLFALAVTTRGWRGRLALASVALFFGAVLLAADNRGSILAGALTLGALATFWQPRLLPLVPIAGLATLSLLAAGLAQRGLDLGTIGQRFWFWESSLYLARELPLTGAGLGTQSVQLTYQAYFQPVQPPFSHAHNIYLQALLEQGIFGLLGLVGLTLATLWVGWQGTRDAHGEDRWTRAARLAGLGVALAMFATGLGEITALSTVGGAVLLAALGLLGAAAMTKDAGQQTGATLGGQPTPSSLRRWRGRSGTALARRTSVLAAVGAAVTAIVLLLATGWGTRGVALGLQNLGTVALNQATISEDTTRAERARYAEQATALLRAAAGLDGNNASIQRNLALALAAGEDDRRGRAAADRARAITPSNDSLGQFQLGRAYVALGVWGEAIRSWQAAEAAPQLLQLGGRLVRSRNWDQAIAAYTATAVLQPNSSGAYDGIARVARERGERGDNAAAYFEPMLARGGTHERHARVQIARIYREAGQPAQALEALQLAEQGWWHPELVVEKGLTLAQAGRSVEAEPLLAEAIELRPDQAELLLELGLVQARLGKHATAVATARAGLAKLGPRNLAQRVPLLALIGDSLLALGRTAEALAAYEEGLALAPDDARLRDGAAQARSAGR